MSPKLSGDSKWGQRCWNSIPEPRQQLMIKTSSPERDGQKLDETLRKTTGGNTWKERRKQENI